VFNVLLTQLKEFARHRKREPRVGSPVVAEVVRVVLKDTVHMLHEFFVTSLDFLKMRFVLFWVINLRADDWRQQVLAAGFLDVLVDEVLSENLKRILLVKIVAVVSSGFFGFVQFQKCAQIVGILKFLDERVGWLAQLLAQLL